MNLALIISFLVGGTSAFSETPYKYGIACTTSNSDTGCVFEDLDCHHPNAGVIGTVILAQDPTYLPHPNGDHLAATITGTAETKKGLPVTVTATAKTGVIHSAQGDTLEVEIVMTMQDPKTQISSRTYAEYKGWSTDPKKWPWPNGTGLTFSFGGSEWARAYCFMVKGQQ